MTTQKDDAMWKLIEETMSPNRSELCAVEREFGERAMPASRNAASVGTGLLSTEEVDRLQQRAEVIVRSAAGPACTPSQGRPETRAAGLQVLAATSAALLLVLSLAWVDTDKHFNRRPMLARSIDLEQSINSATAASSSEEFWGAGMQFLTSRHISAVEILLQLRQADTPVGRAAHSACRRYSEGIEPDAIGTRRSIQELAMAALDEGADATTRVDAIRKIEWFLTTTEAAAREADASTPERAVKKAGFLRGVDRIRRQAAEQTSSP